MRTAAGLLLLCAHSFGAIAFVAAADLGNNGGSGSLTASYTVGSGTNRMLVVPLAGDVTADSITGVTYNGTALTLAAKNVLSGDRYGYLYYLLSPPSGAHNVVITTSNGYILAGAADYTGVKQSGQPDATATNTVLGVNPLTTTLVTIADNSWTILATASSGLPLTAGTGSTRRSFDAAFGAWGLFDSNAPIHPAGSTSMTMSQGASGNGISSAMASFAPAIASASTSQAFIF